MKNISKTHFKVPPRHLRRATAGNALVNLASSNPEHVTTQKARNVTQNVSTTVFIFSILSQLYSYIVYILSISLQAPRSFFPLPFNRISEAQGFFFVLKACLIISL